MKIKLLSKLIYLWDVLFTLIDNWQLRIYVKLKEILNKELHKKYVKPSKIKRESYNSWEDVK